MSNILVRSLRDTLADFIMPTDCPLCYWMRLCVVIAVGIGLGDQLGLLTLIPFGILFVVIGVLKLIVRFAAPPSDAGNSET